MQVNQLVISPKAGEALREIDRDDQMSEARRSELYDKIRAGITGRITREQWAQIRALRQASLKPGDIGYVPQPDKERAVLTEGEQAREP